MPEKHHPSGLKDTYTIRQSLDTKEGKPMMVVIFSGKIKSLLMKMIDLIASEVILAE